jgi:hypothetical protein
MGHPFFHHRLYLEAGLFHYPVAFLSPPLHLFPTIDAAPEALLREDQTSHLAQQIRFL